MTPDKASAWLQFAGGVAVLFLQIWNGLHGGGIDATHTAVGIGLLGGGMSGHIQANKIK